MMKYDNMHLITQKMDLEHLKHKFLIINKHRYFLGNNIYFYDCILKLFKTCFLDTK